MKIISTTNYLEKHSITAYFLTVRVINELQMKNVSHFEK